MKDRNIRGHMLSLSHNASGRDSVRKHKNESGITHGSVFKQYQFVADCTVSISYLHLMYVDNT